MRVGVDPLASAIVVALDVDRRLIEAVERRRAVKHPVKGLLTMDLNDLGRERRHSAHHRGGP